MRKINFFLLFFLSYGFSNVFIGDFSVSERATLKLPFYYKKPWMFQKRFSLNREGVCSEHTDSISTSFLAYGVLTSSESCSLGETYSFVYRSFRFLFYLGEDASEACDILYCTIEYFSTLFTIVELGNFDRDKNYLIDLIIEDDLESGVPLVSVEPYQFSLNLK